ncbi:MAG: BspA family leucine-rich repeat surface protein, partial [Erysipelotrichaceae bacterium]|nr:BspA family leucine-rich repeat surface protein [Erysipelotrichaceae bacterium]
MNINAESENHIEQTGKPVSGKDGVRWFIDRDNVLYIEAGEVAKGDHWKNYGKQIREIRVIPTENCSKLILPVNSAKLFEGLSALTDIEPDIFDTSQVVLMDEMFSHCSSLKDLDLSSFDTSKTKSMHGMFRDCSSLKNLDLSSFDTSQVDSMNEMFAGCFSLKNLDLSSFDTSQVDSM